MNKKEIWKDIKNYEGLYQISSYGRVKSLERKDGIGRNIKERILKPGINTKKYFFISLSKNNNQKTYVIHRLVALHFIPNSLNKPQVNHIDSDKSNNYIDNLEWCTHSENIQHAWKNGLCENVRKTASINGKKYCSKKVKCIETGIIYISVNEASRQTGFNRTNIAACCRGLRKTANKYTWKYI